MKLAFLSIFALVVSLLGASSANATTYFSRASGNWNVNTTWSLTSGGAAVGVGVFPVAGDVVNIEGGFTVTINGANPACATLTIGTATAGTLTFNDTANRTLTVTGDLSVASGSTFTTANAAMGNVHVLNLAGNLTNGGTFDCVNSDDVINVTFNGTTTVSGNTCDFNSVNITGTLIAPSGNMNVFLDWTKASAATFTPGTGTVTFNGSADQDITGTATSQTFNNVVVNKSASELMNAGSLATLTVNDLTEALGNIDLGTGITLNINGNFSQAAGNFNPGNIVNIKGDWTRDGGTQTVASTDTVTFNGSAAQTIKGTAATTFDSLTINNAAGVTNSHAAATEIDDTLTLTSGTFTLTTTLTMLSGVTTISRANGSLSGTPTFAVGNTTNVTYTGATGPITTGTELPTSATVLANLTINNAGQTVTLNAAVTVNGTFAITAGTFDTSNFAVTFNGSFTNSGTFTANASPITIGGSSGNPSIAGFSTTGALTFTRTSNTATLTGGVTAASLTMNGGGTLNLGTAQSHQINGDVTFTNGTLNGGTTSTLSLTGNFTGAGGTFTASAGTVNFNGSAAQTINRNVAIVFNNLTINNAAGVTLNHATGATTWNVTLTLTAGTFTLTTALTIGSSGTPLISRSGGSLSAAPSGADDYDVTYTGNSKTTGSELNGTLLNNVTVNLTSGQTLTLGAAVIAAGDITIGAGSTLDVSASNFAISVGDDWTNNGGTFTPQSGTVSFINGGTSNINGTAASQTFNNVVMNKTATQNLDSGGSTTTWTFNDLTLTQGDFNPPATLNINGDLTQTGGTWATGANTNIKGNWTRNGGTFTPGAGEIVTFNGSTTQTIGGLASTAFTGLTINNSAGVSLDTAGSVSQVLTLTTDLTATAILTQTGTSAGTGDVVGTVQRSLAASIAGAFGNPNVQVTNGTAMTLKVHLVKASPSSFSNSVNRTYTLTIVVGSVSSATLRFHYLNGELNGNTATLLDLYRAQGSPTATWVDNGGGGVTRVTGAEPNNYIEQSGITAFSSWTLANGGLAPTAIEMVGYAANRLGKGKVLLEWETGYEVDNLGFNIYRQEGAERVRVNKSLIAGSALFAGPGTRLTAGRSYIWRDKVPEGSDARYWLEEIELNGTSIWHGPIFVGDNPPSKSKFQLASNEVADAKTIDEMNSEMAGHGSTLPVEEAAPLEMVGTASLMKADGFSVAAVTPWTLGGNAAVKLSVKGEGWYRVPAPDLLAAGLSATADPKRLQLFVDGQQIPMKVVTDSANNLSAIEFYGIGIDTPSTDNHVYWVIVGGQNGKRIGAASGLGGIAGATSFKYAVERRDRAIYLSSIRNGDKENFFGAGVSKNPVNQILNLTRVDTVASGQATIEIAMQGLTLLSHYVTVSLNGTYLGAVDFNGQANKSATFSAPMSLLLEGENTFTLQGQSTVLDVTLVDRIRVTYWRTYAADNNALKVATTGGRRVTVAGFTTGDIRVIDVTNSGSVQEVSGGVVTQQAVDYAVTFAAPGTGNRSLLVFAGDQVRAVAGASANTTSNLRNKNTQADLVIVTHNSFLNNFSPLQALRQAEGLKVAMVDVEDVYDEFSYGNKTPQAIKDLLSYAKGNWRKAPKYVLLAGGASFDPRNYVGQGANDLVPTKLVDTAFMETASDDWLSDFNNDALAEMAIGRLPANNSTEADTMVSKIIAYATSAASASVALSADENDDFNFEAESAKLKPLIPAGISVAEIDRGQVGTTVARQQLLDAIAAGQKIVNYTGHGSSTAWRGSFLTSNDARALTNGSLLPVFVMMTCLNGLFQDVNLDGLAPALMKATQGGAIAVWASSGLTEPEQQTAMNQQLYKLLFPSVGTALNLGDATLKAKAAVTDPDIRRTWILFGDPTTRLK